MREPLAQMAHRGWVVGIYVAPEARGKGCVDALIGAALTHARSEGVVQVHLGVGVFNTRARKAYERAGFKIYGTEPRSLLVGGKYIDEYLMVCHLDNDE